MADERLTARLFQVIGRVQGVGFRFFAMETAIRLGVRGYARNLFDGSVEVHAEAPPAVLAAFRAELERGPRMAHVTKVVEQDIQVTGLHSSFHVKG